MKSSEKKLFCQRISLENVDANFNIKQTENNAVDP